MLIGLTLWFAALSIAVTGRPFLMMTTTLLPLDFEEQFAWRASPMSSAKSAMSS